MMFELGIPLLTAVLSAAFAAGGAYAAVRVMIVALGDRIARLEREFQVLEDRLFVYVANRGKLNESSPDSPGPRRTAPPRGR